MKQVLIYLGAAAALGTLPLLGLAQFGKPPQQGGPTLAAMPAEPVVVPAAATVGVMRRADPEPAIELPPAILPPLPVPPPQVAKLEPEPPMEAEEAKPASRRDARRDSRKVRKKRIKFRRVARSR